MTKQKKLRHSEYYDMQPTFDKLYADSKNGKTFTKLMDIISSEENIRLAYRNIKRNGGSTTAGTDKRTIADIEKLPVNQYVSIVQRKLMFYKPKPVKRVEIPKPNGKMRPLGIPTIIDRLVQQCILQVMEPICEAKFYERSNGFRPNRSAENAIAQCYKMINLQKLYYVVDVDIKGFFDNVNHTKLIQQIWHMGIRDKKLLCIIREMLKAPIIMPNGTVEHPTKGTPQGGILSPLLSNIVLNELDWWIDSQWENMPTKYEYSCEVRPNGTINKTAIYGAFKNTTKLKEVHIVRYADDFKLFCRKRSDAEKVFIAVKLWLQDRLKLEISEEKSKIVNLKRHYSEFLGFEMKAVRKRKRYVVKSHMTEKAISKEKAALIEQVKQIAHVQDRDDEAREITLYNSMVFGIHNYYRYATMIATDCEQIHRAVSTVMKNRLYGRLTKKGQINEVYIRKNYGDSKQIRFISSKTVAPVGYIQTKTPLFMKKKVCKYTPEGRAEIHKNLGINTSIMLALMRIKEPRRSVEYMDNRISLYAAQYGRCAVTGKELGLDEIHSHHKQPLSMGGTDKYMNLVINCPPGHSPTDCIENGYSIVENPKRHGKSYNKWLGDKKKPSHRERICTAIDDALTQKPDSFETLLELLRQAGYEVKGKKVPSLLGGEQKKSIRMDTLGDGYTPADLRAVIAGEKAHTPQKNAAAPVKPEKRSGNLLVDIQAKLRAGKGAGYARWATLFNLKQMAQTVAYLQDHELLDYAVLSEKAAAASAHFNELSARIKAAETRMAEIAVLREHIVGYAKTRDTYVAYRKAGYSKKFLAEHESEITIHKAAKNYFDGLGLKKLPTIKALNTEYAELLAEKKAAYAEYRKAREKMKELLTAKANIDRILELDKEQEEANERREKEAEQR